MRTEMPINTATIVLKTDELLHDIKSRAYIQGQSAEGDAYMLQDIGDEANRDTLVRYINMAYQDCFEMLYAYCEEDVNGEYSNDNTEEESDTYTLTLNLPMSVSKHSMDKISDLLHEYIVCKVISEWCLIAFPSLATMWATKAEDCRAKIKSTHNRRTKPVRRIKTPF